MFCNNAGAYRIAAAIDKSTSVQKDALQLAKDTAFNKNLQDTFEDRVMNQYGKKYEDFTTEGKILVKKFLLTTLLRDIV